MSTSRDVSSSGCVSTFRGRSSSADLQAGFGGTPLEYESIRADVDAELGRLIDG
jgi:hypothetical protein